MSLTNRKSAESRVLLSSRTETATGSGDITELPFTGNGFTFLLNVTAADTAVDDTLNVIVETRIDSSTFIDVMGFQQILGNGAVRIIGHNMNTTEVIGEFDTSVDISAGEVRATIGDAWRIRWVIVNGTAASFTFNVVALPLF